MPVIIIVGSTLVTLALIFYTIGVVIEQRLHRINHTAIIFLSFGLIFDVSATACMIAGSTNSPFTLHGFIGYVGLLAMLIECWLVWQFYLANGTKQSVSKKLHTYTLIAYTIWVMVFLTGIILVTLK